MWMPLKRYLVLPMISNQWKDTGTRCSTVFEIFCSIIVLRHYAYRCQEDPPILSDCSRVMYHARLLALSSFWLEVLWTLKLECNPTQRALFFLWNVAFIDVCPINNKTFWGMKYVCVKVLISMILQQKEYILDLQWYNTYDYCLC